MITIPYRMVAVVRLAAMALMPLQCCGGGGGDPPTPIDGVQKDGSTPTESCTTQAQQVNCVQSPAMC